MQSTPVLMVATCVPGNGLIPCVCFADSKGEAAKWIAEHELREARRDLPGYEDYCRKVKYRLFPGLW